MIKILGHTGRADDVWIFRCYSFGVNLCIVINLWDYIFCVYPMYCQMYEPRSVCSLHYLNKHEFFSRIVANGYHASLMTIIINEWMSEFEMLGWWLSSCWLIWFFLLIYESGTAWSPFRSNICCKTFEYLRDLYYYWNG